MMTSNRKTAWLLAATLACCITNLAMAQQPNQAAVNAIKQNCRSDYMSLCASVPSGTQASLQCLQQHQADLSPQCRTAVAATEGGGATRPPQTAVQRPPAMTQRQEMALMRHACGADYRALCRGVPLGGGNALACLAENRSQLSPGCRSALAEMRAAR